MRKSEKFARYWMPGKRDGGNRPAWAHPEDVVRVLTTEVPEVPDWIDREVLTDVAWLHDVLEDSDFPDTESMFRREFPVEVCNKVDLLSRYKGTSARVYFDTLYNWGDATVLLVKLADRLCNLREGASVFDDARWERYVTETHFRVLPLASRLHRIHKDLESVSLWFTRELAAAARARKIK